MKSQDTQECPHSEQSQTGALTQNTQTQTLLLATRAREAGAHAQFEQIREIEEKLLNEEYKDPQNARIASDLIKWRLSKMLPRVYGDRTHIEHSGEVKTSPKDFAPEWMVELLTGKGTEAPTASGDEDEDTLTTFRHPSLCR